MSATSVVSLHVSEDAVNAAWVAYDNAARNVASLTLDPASTRDQRWQATLIAEQAGAQFRRLYARWLP